MSQWQTFRSCHRPIEVIWKHVHNCSVMCLYRLVFGVICVAVMWHYWYLNHRPDSQCKWWRMYSYYAVSENKNNNPVSGKFTSDSLNLPAKQWNICSRHWPLYGMFRSRVLVGPYNCVCQHSWPGYVRLNNLTSHCVSSNKPRHCFHSVHTRFLFCSRATLIDGRTLIVSHRWCT